MLIIVAVDQHAEAVDRDSPQLSGGDLLGYFGEPCALFVGQAVQ
jgi:hypothetical protein